MIWTPACRAHLLAEKYHSAPYWLNQWLPDLMDESFHWLRDQKVGRFATWKEPLSYKPIELAGKSLHKAFRQGVLRLNYSRRVLAVRIYWGSNEAAARAKRLEWYDGDFAADGGVRKGADLRISGDKSFVQIDARVNRLRFAPDAIPDESTIERVILYVADD